MSGLFTRGRVIVAVVVAVAAVAVGGTALALTTSAASHVVSMSTRLTVSRWYPAGS